MVGSCFDCLRVRWFFFPDLECPQYLRGINVTCIGTQMKSKMISLISRLMQT